jgi:hypothetical protein
LKVVREKNQITYKSRPIEITADFSTETLKARKEWNKVFQAQKENNFSTKILYPARLFFKTEGEMNTSHDK